MKPPSPKLRALVQSALAACASESRLLQRTCEARIRLAVNDAARAQATGNTKRFKKAINKIVRIRAKHLRRQAN